MSIYKELKNKPAKIEIIENPKEVIFTLISCMCDNKYYLNVKKNNEGDFKANLRGNCFSNLQIPGDGKIDLEWAADEGNWEKVVSIINSGTELVQSMRSR